MPKTLALSTPGNKYSPNDFMVSRPRSIIEKNTEELPLDGGTELVKLHSVKPEDPERFPIRARRYQIVKGSKELEFCRYIERLIRDLKRLTFSQELHNYFHDLDYYAAARYLDIRNYFTKKDGEVKKLRLSRFRTNEDSNPTSYWYDPMSFLAKHMKFITDIQQSPFVIRHKDRVFSSLLLEDNGQELPLVGFANLHTLIPIFVRPSDSRPVIISLARACSDSLRRHIEDIRKPMQENQLLPKAKRVIELVATLEWLHAHRWEFSQGSAGVANIWTRTFLDAAGISNGRYKRGVDPNMQAFFTPLPKFIQDFYSFFEKPLEISYSIKARSQFK